MSSAHCPVCEQIVPDGEFCPFCGARLSAGPGNGRFRLSAYADAPGERVLRPWLTTTLFPQLPRRSRPIFRVGLILVIAAAVGFALLGWPVPVAATAVFGLPVLFGVYLREIDIRRSFPARYLALAAGAALVSGIGWALVAGPIVADAYHAALGGQMPVGQLLLCGVAIPITFGLVLVAPTAVVRALDSTDREVLDGFTIGAMSALVANAAATATLLAQQLAMGMTVGPQPVASLLSEVLVEGVAWPLGSVATGGLGGRALWLRPRSYDSGRYRRRTVISVAVLGLLAFSVAMGVVDVAPMPMSLYLVLQLLIALAAVLVLRIVITDALLHEAAGEIGDGQVRCAECDHVVPRKQFCSHCGVAMRTAERAATAVEPQRAAAYLTATYLKVLGPVAAGVGVAVAVAFLVATLVKPTLAEYVCPPDCGHPPLGKPVETNPRFSGDGGAFSVSYPSEGTAYEVTFDPPGMKGVQARYIGGDTGVLKLFGEPARDRTAEQIAQEILTSDFPGAIVDYEIPNASVGYQPGYGVVADVHPRDKSGTFTRLRVIVMVAVKHDYALIATAAGPFHEFSPDYGTGHPSGANLEVAMDMGKYVNSFRWFGDRYQRPSEGG